MFKAKIIAYISVLVMLFLSSPMDGMEIKTRDVTCKFLNENIGKEMEVVILHFLFADLRIQEDYVYNNADFERFKSHMIAECASSSGKKLAKLATSYLEPRQTMNFREMTCGDIESRKVDMNIFITWAVAKSSNSTTLSKQSFDNVMNKMREANLEELCRKNPDMKIYPLLSGRHGGEPNRFAMASAPEIALEMTQDAIKKKRPRRVAALWKNKRKAKGFLKQITRKKLGLELANSRKNRDRAVLDVHIIKNGIPVDMVYMYLEEENGGWLFVDIDENKEKAKDFLK